MVEWAPAGYANFTSGATIFVVAEPSVIVNNAPLFSTSNGQTSNNVEIVEQSPGKVLLFAVYNGSTLSDITGFWSFFYDGTSVVRGCYKMPAQPERFFVNGVQASTGTVSNINNLSRSGNFIGSDFNHSSIFEGKIAEVLIYNTALTSSQRAAVESYLYSRYGLFVSTPVITPGGPNAVVSGTTVSDDHR